VTLATAARLAEGAAEEPATAPARVPAALTVEGVSHAFGDRPVLRDVSLSVPPGGFAILLGLNGAGKTTLFSLITRLYYGASGRISVWGHDLHAEPLAALACIGIVFQQMTLDLDLTVEQNLVYHAALHGMERRAAAPRIAEELERAGLIERRRDKVRHLSGSSAAATRSAASLAGSAAGSN
jgi:ABC-2 type transport system ATP-binding protein